MSADGLLVWSTPGATLGLVVKGGVVVETPPYAHRWAYGRDARELWYLGKRRGVDLTWIATPGETTWVRTTYRSASAKRPSSST